MTNFKIAFKKIKKAHFVIAGILLLLLLSVCLLWFGNSTSMQAFPPMVAQVYFDGEYSVDGGEWHKIVEGEHIPATRGDVTLRGNFHMKDPEGTYVGVYRGDVPVAFYVDHINLTFYEEGFGPFVIDAENSMYGDSACGEVWTAHTFMSDSESLIYIKVHNPHSFGNETAIDEMLSRIAFWTGIDFEKDILSDGEPQRNEGMLLMLVSIVFLGIALFSTLIHVKSSRFIWLLGLIVLFAGAYFLYSAEGISFWSESVVSNTTVLGASMMFYMFFLSVIIQDIIKSVKFCLLELRFFTKLFLPKSMAEPKAFSKAIGSALNSFTVVLIRVARNLLFS